MHPALRIGSRVRGLCGGQPWMALSLPSVLARRILYHATVYFQRRRLDQTMLKGICFFVALLAHTLCQGEEMPAPDQTCEQEGRVTLGGMQYWTDHLVCHGWRIQRHVKFGQFRLLKPSNRVAQTGTYESCRQAFDAVCRQRDFPPISSTVLVSVHGLGRTRNSMSPIGNYVAEGGDFGWINFGYASTRSEITSNAQSLRNALDELALLKREQDARLQSTDSSECGIRFHFIAHSLGNIIIRKVLSDMERDAAKQSQVAWQVGRIVMLGPPNQGSAMANLLQKSNAFRWIAGSSGKDLGAEWRKLDTRLITPACEFAIIAGGKGDEKGYNPLLAGDDDLIVRVEETKLSGAADFAVIPSVHTFLMDRDESKEMALRFLQKGFLTTAVERKRLP